MICEHCHEFCPPNRADGFCSDICMGHAQRITIDRLTAKVDKLRAALLMGVQLSHSGGHGNGKECPTCHFVREAQKAIGLEVGWHPTIKADEQ